MIKSKVILLFIILVSLGSLNSFGQGQDGLQASDNLKALADGGLTGQVATFDGRYEGVRGTQFLIEAWVLGTLTLSGGKEYNDLKMKYDVMGDELVILMPKDKAPSVVNRGIIKSFSLDYLGTKRRFIPLGPNEIKNQRLPIGFYEVIHDGETKWVMKHQKEVLRADYKGAYSAHQRADRIVDNKPVDYILTADGNIFEVKRKAKSIIEVLGNDKDLGKYVKENNINLKDNAGIVLLMEYYNKQ